MPANAWRRPQRSAPSWPMIPPIRIDARADAGGVYRPFDFNMNPSMTRTGRTGRDDQGRLTAMAALGVRCSYADLLVNVLRQTWGGEGPGREDQGGEGPPRRRLTGAVTCRDARGASGRWSVGCWPQTALAGPDGRRKSGRTAEGGAERATSTLRGLHAGIACTRVSCRASPCLYLDDFVVHQPEPPPCRPRSAG